MKKKRTTKKTTNRVPPSIPKCVRKTTDGYTTAYVQSPKHYAPFQFTFRKIDNHYAVYRITPEASLPIDMAHDISLSPTTRHMFTNLTTLKAAIAAVETWLGTSLPELR